MMKHKFLLIHIILLLALGLLISCGEDPLSKLVPQSKVVHFTKIKPKVKLKPVDLSKDGPHGVITGKNSEFVTSDGTPTKTLTFHIHYPRNPGFSTQSLRCQDITDLEVSVSGIAMTPIYADGSVANKISATDGCDVTATISNVPFGAARIGQVRAYSTGPTLITGSTIMAVFDVSSTPTNVQLSYKSTPAGDIVRQIIQDPNPFIASHMDLGDLDTLVDGITVPAGTFPNQTFTVHPSLVNVGNIVTDLLGNGGDSSALSSGNAAYKDAPCTVTGTIAGLLPSDKATVRVSDPGSPAQTALGNGAFSFTTSVTPGSWTVYATGIGGTTYTASGTPTANVATPGSSVDVGTITLTPVVPTLSSLSPTTGTVPQVVTLNGSGFHLNPAENTVDFGGVQLTGDDVIVIDDTQLQVKLPSQIQGTVNVNVTVGAGTSGNQTFDVLPVITSILPNKGLTIITNQITIVGGGFTSGVTVDIGATAATSVNYIGPHVLIATLPTGIPLGFHNVTVTNPNTDSFVENNGYESTAPEFEFSILGVSPTNARPLAADPLLADLVYAGSANNLGMHKTYSRGSSWNTYQNGLTTDNIIDLVVHPLANTFLYCVLDNTQGVYRSDDGGENWQSANLTGTINMVQVHPTNPLHVLAGTSTGIMRSQNAGNSWEAINTGLTNTFIRDIAFDPVTPSTVYAATSGGVFKSTDNGDNWSAVNTGLTESQVQTLVIDPTATNRIYAGTSNGVFKSTDSAANWTNNSTGLGGTNIRKIILDHTTPTTLYVATENGVSKTTNSAGIWINTSNGITDLDVRDIIYDFTSSNRLMITTPTLMFTSSDSGANWATTTAIGNTDVRDVEVSDADNSIIFAATAGGVYRSKDYGASWFAINTALGDLDVKAVEQDPNDPSKGVVGTPTGIFYSSNVGAGSPGWFAATTSLSNVTDVKYTANVTNRVFASTTNGMYRSTDGGNNWTAINSGLTAGDPRNIREIIVNPLNNNVIAIATKGGLFLSTNAGGSWNAKNAGLNTAAKRDLGAFASDPSSPSKVYVGNLVQGAVFKDDDVNSGGGFTNFAQGLPPPNFADVQALEVDVANQNIILAGFGSNSGFWVRNCIAACLNWIEKTEGLPAGPARDVRHIANNATAPKFIYVGTNDGVYRTRR